MVDEYLCARVCDSENQRWDAIGVWELRCNYDRPHTACDDQSRAHASTLASTIS